MAFNIGVGGAWKDIVYQAVGVGGAWKAVAGQWIGVGGAWKPFWFPVNFEGAVATDYKLSPTDSTASISFTNAGLCNATGSVEATDFTWLDQGDASYFDIYVSGTGDTPTGAAVDTWLNLGTTRTWTLTETSNAGVKSFTGTYQIRVAGSGSVLGSALFSLTAETDV